MTCTKCWIPEWPPEIPWGRRAPPSRTGDLCQARTRRLWAEGSETIVATMSQTLCVDATTNLMPLHSPPGTDADAIPATLKRGSTGWMTQSALPLSPCTADNRLVILFGKSTPSPYRRAFPPLSDLWKLILAPISAGKGPWTAGW